MLTWVLTSIVWSGFASTRVFVENKPRSKIKVHIIRENYLIITVTSSTTIWLVMAKFRYYIKYQSHVALSEKDIDSIL